VLGLAHFVFVLILKVRAFVHSSLTLLSDESERFSEHWFVLGVDEGDVATQDSSLKDAVVLVGVDGFLEELLVSDAGLLLEHVEDLNVEGG